MSNARITRNRKVLRRIDLGIAQYGRYLSLSYLSIFILVVLSAGLYQHALIAVLALGIVLLMLTALQVYASLRFDFHYGSGPARWRKRFCFVHLMNTLVWSIFSAWVVVHAGLTAHSFLVLLLSVSVGAVINVAWAPYHRINYLAQTMQFLPLVGALLSVGEMSGIVLAGMLMSLYGILIQQSGILSKRHWHTENTRIDTEMRSRDLEQAVKDAENASQVKAEFLTNITHDIRTPMNSVLGMLALLDDTPLNTQQQQLQRIAVQSGEQLLRLIDDVLDFSRIVTQTIALEDTVFSLRRCINQALELMGQQAHNRGLELCVIYDEDIPLRLKGDPDRLSQVVTNLVGNAVKYSDGSEICLYVHVERVDDSLGELRVDVVDDGKGIADEARATIFEAFARKGGLSGMQSGTGLGLAIAKGLVERMNGQIGFESDQHGTRFWFTARMKISTQQAQKIRQIKPFQQQRVLLVEPTPGLQRTLESVLSEYGCEVATVESTEMAWGALVASLDDRRSIGVVILNQPLRRAFDPALVEQIRADERLNHVGLLVMATLSQRGSRDAWLQAFADVQWLTKPVSRRGLHAALKRLYKIEDEPAESHHKQAAVAVLQEEEAKKVLLVEDNRVNQMVARGMLNKLGYMVTTANNGKEALSLMQDYRYDLVLMDCQMPEMDGYDATRAIREREEQTHSRQRIPIVAMTASVLEGEEARCIASGMDDYLAKPVNKDELASKLLQWLGEAEDNSEPDDNVSNNVSPIRRGSV